MIFGPRQRSVFDNPLVNLLKRFAQCHQAITFEPFEEHLTYEVDVAARRLAQDSEAQSAVGDPQGFGCPIHVTVKLGSMRQPQSKVVRRLTRALDKHVPVTVRRSRLDSDCDTGFVLALTDEWVVLHRLDGVYLDDVVLLRLDLVTKVEAEAFRDSYLGRAVSGIGKPIETFDCPADASVGDLLRIVDQRAQLVGVHLESPDGDWINYGKIHRVGKNRLDLQFIGRDGVWTDYADAWELRDITRIEAGGRYIVALERFGEPAPPVEGRNKR